MKIDNEFDHDSRNDIMAGMVIAFNLHKNPGILKNFAVIFFSLCLNFTFIISVLFLIVLWVNRSNIFYWLGLKIHLYPIIILLSIIVINSLLRAISEIRLISEKEQLYEDIKNSWKQNK